MPENNELLTTSTEKRIITIRGKQVILDRDLADLYGVTTSRLNEQVKRNIKRFPGQFRFQLTKEETSELIANCDRLEQLKHSATTPYAFTEQGVAMLSAVLHSNEAIEISIQIMRSFVSMRHYLQENSQLFQRIECLEYRQIYTDHRIEALFKKIDERTVIPKQKLFYDGQIFDAYQFVSQLISSAVQSIILIDNYIDESVLYMLDKRNKNVSARIITKGISPQLQLDITKHNAQYPAIDISIFNRSHDRFLIIDDLVYHIGASLKDLGKKWFAISLMNDFKPDYLISKIL